MSVTCPCDACGRELPPDRTEVCVDCGRILCAACALPTGHRLVNEPEPLLADLMPLGWFYLRCADTPYSIHTAQH